MKYSIAGPFRLFCALLLLAGLSWKGEAASAPSAKQALVKPLQYALPRMGTEFRIVMYHPDPAEAQKAALAAFDRVEELEDIFSDYRERSEVNRLCQVAVGRPWRISRELFSVLESSLRYANLSSGAFDVTIGPAVQLWRQSRKNRRLPDPADLQKALQKIGYANIVLDAGEQTAMLRRAGMKIDFGGIAKGYAADQALEVLKSRGMGRALVAGGGDIAIGQAPPDKKGWSIEIRKPEAGAGGKPEYLILHDAGVSTSGDFFQFLEIDGRRYSHIINPATGMGTTEAVSATIIARDAMASDALATILCIMPVADGLKLVQSIPGVSARVVRRGPQGIQYFRTPGFPQTVARADRRGSN